MVSVSAHGTDILLKGLSHEALGIRCGQVEETRVCAHSDFKCITCAPLHKTCQGDGRQSKARGS